MKSNFKVLIICEVLVFLLLFFDLKSKLFPYKHNNIGANITKNNNNVSLATISNNILNMMSVIKLYGNIFTSEVGYKCLNVA